jgi:AraC family transcriptional regulator, arabinose operon regulatory protein
VYQHRSIRQIGQYLPYLQISVITAQFRKCPIDWGMDNENPHYDRLYLIKGGNGYFEVNGKKHTPKAGQFVLLPAGIPHRYGTVNEDTYERYFCHFNAKIGNINLFQMLDFPNILTLNGEEEVESIFHRLVHYHNHRSITSKIRERAALLDLVSIFIELCAAQMPDHDRDWDNTAESQETIRVHTILQYIHDHLHERLTLDILAKQVHIHPNYFIRFFKEAVGVSPIQYITTLRVDKAKNLLKNPVLTIKEVAEEVGIPWSHFSKVFHRKTGQSPSEYRNQITE